MAEATQKGYDPSSVEQKWYRQWKERGYFHADEHDEREPYVIVIPLPNVTGHLHLGHALMIAIQDMLIRWKRMQGCNALWMPGTDHAGIATQMVVERDLMLREGKTRRELGREEFLRRVWTWKEAKGGHILTQMEELGASLDWARTRFTMDEVCSRAVRESFVRLYEEGLIYRGWRMVNLSPALQTIVSDLEVEHEENAKGELWSFAYPLTDGSGEIVVATTRPETMLGDTAVAVHPDDERYKHLIGQTVRHPLLGYDFAIIADAELVDPAFGTGAVKVTPGHDPNDFETGRRHDLKLVNLLNMDGTLNENAGPYQGLSIAEARARVKADLTEKGLFRGAKEHTLALGRCQRSGAVIEPFVSQQWFVSMKPLAEPAIAAVKTGATKIIPAHWEKTFDEWMYNIRDWCISRQLWWGHRIPAWHCADCGHVTVAREDPDRCAGCGSTNIRQDEDVLDTWFSSALWPFSTLHWPEDHPALRRFYPGAVMETGFDILFFWVARMMMMGCHFLGKTPFHTVYLHGMIRDSDGSKMSKVKGNVIDPLLVIHGIGLDELVAQRAADAKSVGLDDKRIKQIEKATRKEYPQGIPAMGADALRFALLSWSGQGREIKLDVKRIEGFRFFANKLWNASRFALMNLEDFDPARPLDPAALGPAERWILFRLKNVVDKTLAALEGYAFDQAAMGLYAFFWNELCDWYLELAKPALYRSDDPARRQAAQHTLVRCLDAALRLLHPMMPFITEELWQKLPKAPGAPDSIMIAPYPRAEDWAFADAYAEEARRMERLMELIRAVRNIRGEANIEPGRKIELTVLAHDAEIRGLAEEYAVFVRELARVERIAVVDEFVRQGPVAAGVAPGAELFVPLGDLLNVDEERARIGRQLDKLAKDVEKIDAKLNNPAFVERAPQEVVDGERAQRAELAFKLDKLRRALELLG